jgi:hypothetical protein
MSTADPIAAAQDVWEPKGNPWIIAVAVLLAAFMGGPRHKHRQCGFAAHRRQSRS